MFGGSAVLNLHNLILEFVAKKETNMFKDNENDI